MVRPSISGTIRVIDYLWAIAGRSACGLAYAKPVIETRMAWCQVRVYPKATVEPDNFSVRLKSVHDLPDRGSERA